MKQIILILAVIVLLAIAWYGYKAYTGKVKSLTEVEATSKLSATDLIHAFVQDSASANKEYLGKVVEVTGYVKAVEKDQASATLVLGEKDAMSSVRCSMDTTENAKVAGVQEGSTITVKGACTGFMSEELLGSDVILNRCILTSHSIEK